LEVAGFGFFIASGSGIAAGGESAAVATVRCDALFVGSSACWGGTSG